MHDLALFPRTPRIARNVTADSGFLKMVSRSLFIYVIELAIVI